MSDAADYQASRQRAIDFARGSVRYEGFALSAEAERIGEQFVAGHLTIAEYVEAIKALSCDPIRVDNIDIPVYGAGKR